MTLLANLEIWNGDEMEGGILLILVRIRGTVTQIQKKLGTTMTHKRMLETTMKPSMIKIGGNSRRHLEIIPKLSTERGNTWKRRRNRTKNSSGRGNTLVQEGRRKM